MRPASIQIHRPLFLFGLICANDRGGRVEPLLSNRCFLESSAHGVFFQTGKIGSLSPFSSGAVRPILRSGLSLIERS